MDFGTTNSAPVARGFLFVAISHRSQGAQDLSKLFSATESRRLRGGSRALEITRLVDLQRNHEGQFLTSRWFRTTLCANLS